MGPLCIGSLPDFCWLFVFVFSLGCVYLCAQLPCAFDGWVPILDFYLQGFSSSSSLVLLYGYAFLPTTTTIGMLWSILYTSIRASPPTLHMWTSKNISHIQALLVSNFFSNPTHKTETGTASKYVGETTNSNPVGQIKLSTQLETRSKWTNSTMMSMFTTLFQGSSKALKAVDFIRVSSGGFTAFEWWTSHPRFPMQGHILNIGGDALILVHVGFGIKSIVYWVCSWYLLLCGYV
jgi:hypothetical protein